MRVPYTYLEAEYIERQYDEQVPARVIAEEVNNEFHSGSGVRTAAAVYYVVGKFQNDPEWVSRLEERWLAQNET